MEVARAKEPPRVVKALMSSKGFLLCLRRAEEWVKARASATELLLTHEPHMRLFDQFHGGLHSLCAVVNRATQEDPENYAEAVARVVTWYASEPQLASRPEEHILQKAGKVLQKWCGIDCELLSAKEKASLEDRRDTMKAAPCRDNKNNNNNNNNNNSNNNN